MSEFKGILKLLEKGEDSPTGKWIDILLAVVPRSLYYRQNETNLSRLSNVQ